jgi:hypothetical protein
VRRAGSSIGDSRTIGGIRGCKGYVCIRCGRRGPKVELGLEKKREERVKYTLSWGMKNRGGMDNDLCADMAY